MSTDRVGQGQPSTVVKADIEEQISAAIPLFSPGWIRMVRHGDEPVAAVLNENLRAVMTQVVPGFGTATVARSSQQIRWTKKGRDKPY